MSTRGYIILQFGLLMATSSLSAQVDGSRNFIDSCSKRWKINGNVRMTGYNIQKLPISKDSITITVVMHNDFYRFTSNFLDSLKRRNKFIKDPELKNSLASKIIVTPPTPKEERNRKDIILYGKTMTMLEAEKILKCDTCIYKVDGIVLSRDQWYEDEKCYWMESIQYANRVMDSIYRKPEP